MTRLEGIERLFKISVVWPEALTWWIGKDGELKFGVLCSDVFWWGTADAEEITVSGDGGADLDALEQALEDIREAVGGRGEECDGFTLWAARKRGMRPQGAVYKDFSTQTWDLFNACGPPRVVGLGNPHTP